MVWEVANIHERINEKPVMLKKYKVWYPTLDNKSLNILMQQYFYPVGLEATSNTLALDAD